MSYFNQKFYKKAYLLEFKDGTNTDTIAFSLPPQSEDFEFSQRIGETKTFGGVVIEDYGNDNCKITLSGSTVNSEARIISKGDLGVGIWANGEEEIFEIKSMIDKYGESDKLNKKIYLYSLDTSLFRKNYKYWQVVINSFTIKRSKENPMAYNYTLNCTGLVKTKKNLEAGSWLENFISIMNSACAAIESGIQFFETGLSYYRRGLDLISTLKDVTLNLENSLNRYVSALTGFSSVTEDYFRETLALGDTIIKSAERLTLGTASTLFQSAVNVNKAAAEFVDYIVNFEEPNISTDLLELYQSSTEDIKNTWIIISREIESNANKALAMSKIQTQVLDYTIQAGDIGEDDTVIKTYGYVEKVAKDSDTWDSLAQKYYNNPELASALALYNGANNGSDQIIVGSKIQIPILNKTESSDGSNLVYATPDQRDNYGIDIMIDDNGDLALTQDDFVTIKGKENLSQAIDSRLRTAIGGRIRLNVYGIRATIGSSTEAEAYLLSSIENTLLEDPRIKKIENLEYQGVGDHLKVKVVYTDINNESQSYGGTI